VIKQLIAVLLIATAAEAGELRNAAHDAKALATAPLHWRHTQWQRFGEGAAAVAIVGLLDKPVMDAIQRNRSSFTNSFAKVITPFGGGRALQLSVLMFAGGALLHDGRIEGAGRDALISELWAAGLVTPVLKRAFGRARPLLDQGSHSFHPGKSASGDYESFPSGHATNAFAFATAVAEHFHGPVPAIAYALASGVAFSRVNDNVHWPSDVLAGALIGRAVAKGVTFRHTHVNLSFTINRKAARSPRAFELPAPGGAFASPPAWPR
jgi:membrane-associated phospholipid phosphatase